jgi:hypothetical protein
LIGYAIAIVGVGYGLSAAGLGQEWILAIVLVMIGLGIVYAMSRSQRDKLAAGRNNRTGASHQTIIQQDGSPERTTRRESTYQPRD